MDFAALLKAHEANTARDKERQARPSAVKDDDYLERFRTSRTGENNHVLDLGQIEKDELDLKQ